MAAPAGLVAAGGSDPRLPPRRGLAVTPADGSDAGLRRRAERALDWLSILLSDVRYGLGAYLGVYLLTEHGWDEAGIGLALSLGGLSGLLAQAPLGAFVDWVRAKRALLAVCVLVVTAACLAIPLAPRFWPVALAGVVGSLAGCMITPALAAISLGVVRQARFARRAGRNEALFHLGNAGINLIILLGAGAFGPPLLFWLMAATGLASAAASFAIPRAAIDLDAARGLEPGAGPCPSPWQVLAGSRPLLVFALCGALFHFANGAMLGLVAQLLARQNAGQGLAFTAACAIAAQATMVPMAWLASRKADGWGRRPLLLLAFAALALRGWLYTWSHEAPWLIAVQLLDGIGAGLIGALYPVVIADLTRGTGHFAAAQGAVGTIHGTGGILSGAVAGMVVVSAGYDVAFLMLAGSAALGGLLFWGLMPETKDSPACAVPAVAA
ncbi:MAG: MFS transporter [Acetobacteraceae bacterium]|nr:MFS transporter [Acetobacteraceae bacterium]